MKNKKATGQAKLIGYLIGTALLIVLILVIGANRTSVGCGVNAAGSNTCAPKDPSFNDSTSSVSTNNRVATTSVDDSNPTPLSLAIQDYSESNASRVDVLATITQLVPEDSSGVDASFGNTIIVKDGVYSAAVHGIDSADFQNLAIGDWVEIQSGYMQEPNTNVAQIVRTGSVTVQLPASENPQ